MCQQFVRTLLATFVVAFLFTGTAAAQQGTLTGTVTNETGAAVPQAQVTIRGGAPRTGVLANDQGVYLVNLPAGSYVVIVSHVAHADARFDVSVGPSGTTTLDISLLTQAAALTGGGVVVTVDRTSVGAGGRLVESAATTDVITSQEIQEFATFNSADHLRNAPGVDVVTHGMQNSNIVVRGFNNIFSGSLHMLSDYRLAGVPSLRVNLLHYIPTIDDDIDRIEVVLGPGSALYGPNTANGVVHIISKSPLSEQGTSFTLGSGTNGGGGPSAYQGSMRSAFLLSENLGVKISGQYLSGDEWEYVDPTEQTAQAFADANPAVCQADKITRGLSTAEAGVACGRIGDRKYEVERWSLEARADYQFAEDGTFVTTYGRNTSSGIELTGLGAGQTEDWVYDFFQARLSKGRLFAQGYYNGSNSGNSFLLRDGVTLVDESSLKVAQVQHGIDFAEGRQDFTYGFDYYRTNPASSRRIYGAYEDVDEMTEWGGYLQSKTALMPKLDLIIAGRIDSHSVLPNNVFSPRAALVFKPNENHGIRLTYNKAFSTPSALNYFLDIGGGFAPPPIGALGFTTRAYGSGLDGWSLRGPDDTFAWMRSPFTPAGSGGAGQLVPAQTPLMWQYYVGVLAAAGGIDPATAAFLSSLTPGNGDIVALAIDPNTQAALPLSQLVLPDLPPTIESTTQTFEVGWTGVISDRISIAADLYYTRKNDFISPLLVQTPLIGLDPVSMEAYLTPIVGPATAAALSAGAGKPGSPIALPLGVQSSNNVGAQGADLIVSYRNVGDIDLWGGDISFQAFLTNELSMTGSFSHVSDDTFPISDGSPIALNAPKEKGTVGLAYRNVVSGLSASARVRFASGFPAISAGFDGDVDSSSLVDLTAGYTIPSTRATLQASVTNLFDTAWQSFVGVPAIGRFMMLRVKYDLF
ncbi:MAG: TonB-dependent receptor [Longimicrobiales bacterium]|nr:TonB-dependent receptor [Longimicrobiales bacterium]